MDMDINSCTDRLIDAIKNSRDYQDYKHCSEAIDGMPGVFDKIMELRKLTVQLYHSDDEEALQRGTEDLAGRYDELLKIPNVNLFLESEEALLKILRDVSRNVMDAMELRVPDL